MSTWYRELDRLPDGNEHVITAEASVSDTVQLIMTDAGLASEPAGTVRAAVVSIWLPVPTVPEPRPLSRICDIAAIPAARRPPRFELGADTRG